MKTAANRQKDNLSDWFASLEKSRYFVAGAVYGIFGAPGTAVGAAGNCAGSGAAGTACLVTGADAPSIRLEVFLEAL